MCNRCSIVLRANTKPGKHLEFSHPAMQAFRQHVSMLVSEHKADPRLLCNFDQVWSMNFRPRPRTLQKVEGRGDPMFSKRPSLKKVQHCFERCLERPFSNALVKDCDDAPVLPPPGLTGGRAANVAVESYRLPHTLTSLSWSDGHVGRGFITCNEEHITENQRQALNQDLFPGVLLFATWNILEHRRCAIAFYMCALCFCER